MTASITTYYLGLLRPYNLFTLGLRPLLNSASLTKGQPVAQAQFVLTFAILSGLYYLAWRLCRGSQARGLWIILIASAVIINIALLWLYPIDAADIFDNILHARVQTIYHGNPFYDRPSQYSSDIFYRYAGWPTRPSAYGPLWELLAAGVSRLAGNDKLINILAFKLLGVIFYFGSVGVIANTLRRVAPGRALQGACLFALNPLVLYETAGNGHNDIVMVFFIVLALAALARRWLILAALAATAGALTKFIPVLIFPILLVYSWRVLANRVARLRTLSLLLCSCTVLVVAAYAPFWRNAAVFGLGRKEALFTTSLPALLQANLETHLGVAQSQSLVSQGALVFMGLGVLAAMWRTWVETPVSSDSSIEETWLVPVKTATLVLLGYLLFACLWFQSWYGLWPLALAALLPEGESARLAVLLSYAAIWKTIIFDYFLVPGNTLPPRVWRETWLAPATFGIIWAYGLYTLVRKWQRTQPPWPLLRFGRGRI